MSDSPVLRTADTCCGCRKAPPELDMHCECSCHFAIRTSNPLGDLLRRLREDGGRYLVSVALTREERNAQPEPTFGGKGHVRWLTEEEYAALCALAPSDETNSLPDPALLNEIIKPVPQHEAEAFAQSGVGYPAEKAFVQLCAPHGKDWLTCPECAKAADKMAVKEREGKL